MEKLIYFVNLVLIVVVCELNKHNIDAKPKRHYGRCTTNNIMGTCIPEDQCDTLDSIEKALEKIFVQDCNSTLTRETLVCCPVARLTPVITTAKPKITVKHVNLPEPPACGTSLTDRITGGVNTALSEFPWMVLLRYTLDGVDFTFNCGGSLISDRWVLTAAHCLESQRLIGYEVQGVRLGEWNLDTNPDCVSYKSGRQQCVYYKDINVDNIITHPGYTGLSTRFINDIALLHLTEAAPISLYIFPICLPPPANDDSADVDFINDQMDISGWGWTTARGSTSAIKLKTTLTVWPLENCTVTINSITRNTLRSQQPTKLQFCASGVQGQSSCNGDSGGPIMGIKQHTNGNHYYYVNGIISYGLRDCSTRNWPVIFTKVDSYVTWIRDKIGELS